MRQITVNGRTLFALAGTRAMLGAGAGLLLASRFRKHDRERIGRALLTIGILTTVPLIVKLRRARHAGPAAEIAVGRPWGQHEPHVAGGMHSAF